MLWTNFAFLSSLLLSLATLSGGQEDDDTDSVQELWVAPSAPDFSTALTIGEDYTIAWSPDLWTVFSIYAPSADVTNSDLWITGFDQHQFAHLVAQRVGVNDSIRSDIVWRVNVTSDELLATNRWVFRFLPSGQDFSETGEQVSSPGFNITAAIVPTSTTSTVSSTSTSSSSESTTGSIPTTSSAVATITQEATSPPRATAIQTNSSGLSTGAKAGIGIGAVLGSIGLLATGWFIARRKKSRPHEHPPVQNHQIPTGHPEIVDTTKYVMFPSSNEATQQNVYIPPSEFEQPDRWHHGRRAELDG